MRLSSAPALILGAMLLATSAAPARAGCGCEKPPPPQAAIRPFFGYADQTVTLFDRRLRAGREYEVRFTSSIDGSVDWSRGTTVKLRDLADRRRRVQLPVTVGNLPLGPCSVTVWRKDKLLYSLGDDQFTIIASPMPLHEDESTAASDNYRAAIGKDGTTYLTVDVTHVTESTTFLGLARGFPLRFEPENVTMYNLQGYLMQVLDPSVRGLFRISRGDGETSDRLDYWRHEFATYKREHRQLHVRQPKRGDANWHRDGSPHIDHNIIVVAVRGTLPGNVALTPGATPAFRLEVESSRKSLDQDDDDRDPDDPNDHDRGQGNDQDTKADPEDAV
jgi:hypothetical protein